MKTKMGISILLLMMLVACARCAEVRQEEYCSKEASKSNLLFFNFVQYIKKPIQVYYDENQTPEIATSIQMWNSSQLENHEVFIKTNNTKDAEIEVYDYDFALKNNMFSNQINQLKPNELAGIQFRDMSTSHCIIISKSDTWYLLSHELGHCLGFTHDPEITSVMYPCPFPNSEITFAIKALLKSLNL